MLYRDLGELVVDGAREPRLSHFFGFLAFTVHVLA